MSITIQITINNKKVINYALAKHSQCLVFIHANFLHSISVVEKKI